MDIPSSKKELKETAKQESTDTQTESSPNFYRELGEESEPGMNDLATLITCSVASIGKISASENRSVPEINDQDTTDDGIETSTMEIEKISKKVKTAATKRKLCATAYS